MGSDQSVQPDARVTQVCCWPPVVQRVAPTEHWLVQVDEVTHVPPLHTWPGEHVVWSTQSVQPFESVWQRTGAPEDAHCVALSAHWLVHVD